MLFLLVLLIAKEDFPAEGGKVVSIQFNGNKVFSSKKLKAIMSTTIGKPYDEFQIRMDEKRLTDFYKNKGFKKMKITKFETKTVDAKKKSISCKIYLKEGAGTYIKDIVFEGNKSFSSEYLRGMTKLKPKALLNDEYIILANYAIADFYTKKGYAYAEVNDSLIEFAQGMGPFLEGFDSSKVTVCFKINEGKIARFGDVNLKGKKMVRKEIVQRELTFKKGDIYSPTKLYESQAKIYGTELFESVKFELPDIDSAQKTQKQPDTLGVTFLLEEKQPRWVGLSGGIETDQEIRTWIESAWGHMNLWGNGQRLEIKANYKVNPFDLKEPQGARFDMSYFEPYFFNSSFKAEAMPFYEFEINKKDTAYKLEDGGIQGKVGKYLGKFLQSFVSYNYKLVGKEGAVGEKGGTANSMALALSWDSRNDVFYPRRGALSSISYEYAGGFLGGNYRFKKFIVDFAYYCPFLRTTVVTSRIKIGGISGISPLESKFLLGGTNAIRGYPNIIYASEGQDWLGVWNLEYRIPIVKNFELSYFIDVGNAWETREEVSSRNIKVGIGFGIRYKTPIGPLRVDYGYGLTEAGTDKGRVYFNLGYMF